MRETIKDKTEKIAAEGSQGEDPSWRTTVNLVVAILCILLFSAGYFLIDGLDKLKKVELCLESGSKACQRLPVSK